mgnify:CR=1 FL=1
MMIPEPCERKWGCGPLCGRKLSLTTGFADVEPVSMRVARVGSITAGPGVGGGYAVNTAVRKDSMP